MHSKFAGSIPSQGTCLGCGFDPLVGACRRNQWLFLAHADVSLSLSCPFPVTSIMKYPWVRSKKKTRYVNYKEKLQVSLDVTSQLTP